MTNDWKSLFIQRIIRQFPIGIKTIENLFKFSLQAKAYSNTIKVFYILFIHETLSMKTDLASTYYTVYIFNVLHIGSMIGLSFKIVNDYIRNTIFIQYDMVFLLMAIVSMASGYMMTLLFPTNQMGVKKNIWISWHNLKLLVTLILFLPIYKFLPILSSGIVTARFIWLIALVFLSPIAKFYREHYSKFTEAKTQ